MITINEPKIIANVQKYKFESIFITNNHLGMNARITFGIYDENDTRIDEKSLVYEGEDYNTFWNNFNSGKFLYEELELGIEVPNEVENEFIN